MNLIDFSWLFILSWSVGRCNCGKHYESSSDLPGADCATCKQILEFISCWSQPILLGQKPWQDSGEWKSDSVHGTASRARYLLPPQRVSAHRHVLAGCEQLPGSSWDDHWDEGLQYVWLPPAVLHPCSSQAVSSVEDLGEHFGLRRASPDDFAVTFVWGPLGDAVGSGICCPCQMPIPDGHPGSP